jgi:rubredoxin
MTTPAALPPFSGDDTTCPKCSNADAFTRYRPAGEHGSDEAAIFGPSTRGERLERTCARCDYVWDEALNPPKGDEGSIHIDVHPDPPHVAEAIRDIRRFGTPPTRH